MSENCEMKKEEMYELVSEYEKLMERWNEVVKIVMGREVSLFSKEYPKFSRLINERLDIEEEFEKIKEKVMNKAREMKKCDLGRIQTF